MKIQIINKEGCDTLLYLLTFLKAIFFTIEFDYIFYYNFVKLCKTKAML